MDDLNWGKIVVRVLAGIFLLSFCQTIIKTTSNRPQNQALNSIATLRAERGELFAQIEEYDNVLTQFYDSATKRGKVSPTRQSNVVQPTRTPRPTSTRQPSITNSESIAMIICHRLQPRHGIAMTM